MSPSHVPTFHGSRRRQLLALGAATLLIPAASASAATQTVKVSDASGDQTSGGPTGIDIRSAVVAQNTSNGAITATITFAAALPQGTVFAVGLGTEAKECNIDNPGTVAFIGTYGEATGGIWSVAGDATPHPFTPTVSGATVKVASGGAAALKKVKWDCARVSAQLPGTGDVVFEDQAVAGGPSIGSQVIVLTDKPDGDKDGIPDVADACPAVPGSTANGCLAVAAKKSLRLGAKKLVVDRLVPAVGAAGAGCKATAKATVKDGKKTIGKGTLAVGVHGSFCHISGVIKIKKHGKKVKLTITGSGFKGIKANVKK